MSRLKPFVRRFGAFALVALAALSLAHLNAETAQANIRLEDGGEVPFYARFEAGGVFHTDDWAVIVFYRPPSCIPPDFNLLDFFHFPSSEGFSAFDCGPPTTDGFQIWKNGPDVDLAPLHSELHGLGAVPVWFVGWPSLQATMDDGKVTIGELMSLAPLTGSASQFHEVLHPTESANNSMINYTASGTLSSSGSFWVHARANSASGHQVVQIDLDP